jgi:hypothetical protein
MTYFPFMAHAFAQMRQWRHYAPSGIIAEGVPVLQVLSGTLFNPRISSILHTPKAPQAPAHQGCPLLGQYTAYGNQCSDP